MKASGYGKYSFENSIDLDKLILVRRKTVLQTAPPAYTSPVKVNP